MKIVTSKEIGFCFGVKRAIEKTKCICEKNKKVYSIGEIVHNEIVIDAFPQIEIADEKSIFEINTDNCPILLRAHGVAKEFEKKISNKYRNVVDLTCPIVYNVFGLVEKYSNDDYSTLIYGKMDHPETKAIISRAKRGYVFCNQVELKEILDKQEKDTKFILISQTTMNSQRYKEFKDFILSMDFKDLKVFDTICDVTVKREKATEELIQKCDAILVIGGKKSSNTRKLYEMVKEKGVKGYFVQRKEQLNLDKNIKILGIISGTSTPEKQIDDISNYISESV